MPCSEMIKAIDDNDKVAMVAVHSPDVFTTHVLHLSDMLHTTDFSKLNSHCTLPLPVDAASHIPIPCTVEL